MRLNQQLLPQIHLKYISRTTSRKCWVSLKINKPCSSTESECGMKRRKVTQCDQSPLPGRCESMRVDEGRAGSARKTPSGACLRALSAVVTHAFSSLCAAKRAVSSEVSKTSSLNAWRSPLGLANLEQVFSFWKANSLLKVTPQRVTSC